MNRNIKITYGILMTIAFIVLVIMISIGDFIAGIQVGIDIGAFTIYSGAMLHVATAKVKEV